MFRKRLYEYFVYYKVFSSRGVCIAEANIMLGLALQIAEMSDIEKMQEHIKANLRDGTIPLVSANNLIPLTEDIVSTVLIVNYILLKK